ncbi:AMP-binding protein [Tistrella bauzanensis]
MPTGTDGREAALRARLDATPTPYDLLAQIAVERPDHPALDYLPDAAGSPPITISYAALVREIRQMTAALRAAGVGPEDGVAILLPFVPQAVMALIAATAAGIAFPMNLLLSAEALTAQMTLARVRWW